MLENIEKEQISKFNNNIYDKVIDKDGQYDVVSDSSEDLETAGELTLDDSNESSEDAENQT